MMLILLILLRPFREFNPHSVGHGLPAETIRVAKLLVTLDEELVPGRHEKRWLLFSGLTRCDHATLSRSDNGLSSLFGARFIAELVHLDVIVSKPTSGIVCTRSQGENGLGAPEGATTQGRDELMVQHISILL